MEFRRRKAQSLEHGPVYIHELKVEGMSPVFDPTDPQSPFKITATRSGINLEGKLTVAGPHELRSFAKCVADAHTDYQNLKPNLSTNLSGH